MHWVEEMRFAHSIWVTKSKTTAFGYVNKCMSISDKIAEFILETGEVVNFKELREMIDSEELIGRTKVGGVNILSTWTEKAIVCSHYLDALGVYDIHEFVSHFDLSKKKVDAFEEYLKQIRVDYSLYATSLFKFCFNERYPDYINMCGDFLRSEARKSVRRGDNGFSYAEDVQNDYGTNVIDWLLQKKSRAFWFDNGLFAVSRRCTSAKAVILVYKAAPKLCLELL